MRRGDVTWQYGTKVNDKGRVRCNFCNKKMGDDDQKAEFDVQMERARIASIQELNYRQMEIQEMYGRRDSASSTRQPQEHVVPGRRGCGPSLLRSTCSRLKHSFSSRPFSNSRLDFYPQIGASIAEARPSVRGPTAKELAGPCLEAVVHDVDKHIALFKVCWPGTGVTIMTDGWKDKSHRGIVYHSSIDSSRKRHTERLIYAHLDKIVDEVRLENVVQVVTDNAVNYRKASLLLMERRLNLYWTPCAAHCINLMLKEIGKLKRVKYYILKSKLITRFIYTHTYLHALMREHCMREIVKESTTRFATAFLTIQSILINKVRLRSMIRSNEWQTDRAAMSQLGRQVETTLLDRRFWTRLWVLRLSDFDDKPAMGFLFDAMRCAMEAIFEKNIWNEDILEIVDLFLCLSVSTQWWTIHGIRTKQLQKIAVRILSQTCAASGYYTPINLDYIFMMDLVDEWVSLRTPLLDQDFLSGAVADMHDNVNLKQLTVLVSPVPVQTSPNLKTD
ncbi:hypothetical protein AMTRI_Chr10g4550 [Amborella trichopoda]